MKFKAVILTVTQIRELCQSQKITVQQLARNFKNHIIEIMKTLIKNTPKRNLANAMTFKMPEVSKKELIQASDSQTFT